MTVIKATDTEFEQTIATREHVIVKYSADWCGTCRLFAPKYQRMAEAAQYQHVLFLEMDAETSPIARQAARVTNLPFFAVFKQGQLVGSVAASQETAVADLLTRFNQTSSSHC
jgi:thioredoxin 1